MHIEFFKFIRRCSKSDIIMPKKKKKKKKKIKTKKNKQGKKLM